MHNLHCSCYYSNSKNCEHCYQYHRGHLLNNAFTSYQCNHQQFTGLSDSFPSTSSSGHPAYYYPSPSPNQNSSSSSVVPSWNTYQSTSYFHPWNTPAATNDVTLMSGSTRSTFNYNGSTEESDPGGGPLTSYQYTYQIPSTSTSTSFYQIPQSSMLPPPPSSSTSTSTPKRATKRKRPLGNTPSTPTTPTTRTPKPKKPKVKPTIIDDEVALKIFRELRVTTSFLNSGKVLAWALPPDDPCFILIHDYIQHSQEHAFGVKILTILRIIPQANILESPSSSPAPLSFSEDPSTKGRLRKMLWHGTRKGYLTAILENGLKLPASHGQMFGSGIYFADRVSKSCQYCDNSGRAKGTAYLFLCDVLLGSMFEAFNAMPQLNQPPEEYIEGIGSIQYDSVQGIGNNVPDKQWDQLIDGCVWPTGPTVKNKERGEGGKLPSLNFNEYIVYDTKNVQPKYLVKVEFTKQPVHENLY